MSSTRTDSRKPVLALLEAAATLVMIVFDFYIVVEIMHQWTHVTETAPEARSALMAFVIIDASSMLTSPLIALGTYILIHILVKHRHIAARAGHILLYLAAWSFMMLFLTLFVSDQQGWLLSTWLGLTLTRVVSIWSSVLGWRNPETYRIYAIWLGAGATFILPFVMYMIYDGYLTGFSGDLGKDIFYSAITMYGFAIYTWLAYERLSKHSWSGRFFKPVFVLTEREPYWDMTSYTPVFVAVLVLTPLMLILPNHGVIATMPAAFFPDAFAGSSKKMEFWQDLVAGLAFGLLFSGFAALGYYHEVVRKRSQ